MMFDTFPLRQKRTQPRRPQRRQPQRRQLGNLWATLLILVVFLLAGNIGIASHHALTFSIRNEHCEGKRNRNIGTDQRYAY